MTKKIIFENINYYFILFKIFTFFRLELNMELPSGQLSNLGTSTVVSQEQDELTQRLARLRE